MCAGRSYCQSRTSSPSLDGFKTKAMKILMRNRKFAHRRHTRNCIIDASALIGGAGNCVTRSIFSFVFMNMFKTIEKII